MGEPDFVRARIGKVLSGKWKLDALLGTGGMASVYRGTHVRNKLEVAVKVLHPEIGREEVLRARFLREGYVANSIKHPAIVQVFDDSADSDEVYLVMELLEGKTLKQLWQDAERKLPLEQVGKIISRLLDGLVMAHEAGVVHRDLKPDNVFVLNDGTVKILDFGIARVRELHNPGDQITATGATLGTPAFMPPEQALGHWNEVDARSDLFSVGATAWVLLSGTLPHIARGVSELLVAAATRRVRPISNVMPTLAPAVAAVIDQSLAFDREERFASALQMKKAWDSAMILAKRAPTMVLPSLEAQTSVFQRPEGITGPEPERSASKPGSAEMPVSRPSPHPRELDGSRTTEMARPAGIGSPPARPSQPTSSPRARAFTEPIPLGALFGPSPSAGADVTAHHPLHGQQATLHPTQVERREPSREVQYSPSVPAAAFMTNAAVSREPLTKRLSTRNRVLATVAMAIFALTGVVVVLITLQKSGDGSGAAASSSSVVEPAATTPAPPASEAVVTSAPAKSVAPSASSAAPIAPPPPSSAAQPSASASVSAPQPPSLICREVIVGYSGPNDTPIREQRCKPR